MSTQAASPHCRSHLSRYQAPKVRIWHERYKAKENLASARAVKLMLTTLRHTTSKSSDTHIKRVSVCVRIRCGGVPSNTCGLVLQSALGTVQEGSVNDGEAWREGKGQARQPYLLLP